MKNIFGLDFGTTNSVLSVNNEGKVEIIDIDEYNAVGKTLRSVLYFDEDGKSSVGQLAIEKYINEFASGRFMQSIKAFLPDKNFEYTYVNKKRFDLIDLVAIILRAIKKKGEEYIGEEVDSVIMGRPVVFSEYAEKDQLAESRLRMAAEKVGFKARLGCSTINSS